MAMYRRNVLRVVDAVNAVAAHTTNDPMVLLVLPIQSVGKTGIGER